VSAELSLLAQRIVEEAAPGEHLEAFVARSTSTTVKAYQGQVESLTSAHTAGVGVRVVRGGRQGFAHCGTLDEDVVRETLGEARDNAAFAEPDDANGIVAPDGVDPPALRDEWHDGLASMPAAQKIALAVELEDRVLRGDPRITGVRVASWSDGAGEVALATSTGVAGASRATRCSMGVSALASDGDQTQIAGWSDAARHAADLDVEEIARQATERVTRLLGATKPASERVTIVLEPHLAATLFSIVAGMLCGDRLVKGRTPFVHRLGEEIAAPSVHLVDDPTDARSLAADRLDGEGLATRCNPLIVDGVLDRFLHDGYTGRRTGTGSTGSAVRGVSSTPSPGAQALVLRAGDAGDLDAVLAAVGDGILVHSLTGLHSGVNPVSGDFSCGADGLRVTGGALGEPLREFTIASTLQRMLHDVVVLGSDARWLPSGDCFPTVVIGDVALSGA
jgi:PmbA protein